MDSLLAPPCAALELLVMLFQVLGVGSLAVCRLTPGTPWGARGRVGFVVALVGLGLAGALCGARDSQFALFAGVTLTGLLIGMIAGAGPIDLAGRVGRGAAASPTLAA